MTSFGMIVNKTLLATFHILFSVCISEVRTFQQTMGGNSNKVTLFVLLATFGVVAVAKSRLRGIVSVGPFFVVDECSDKRKMLNSLFIVNTSGYVIINEPLCYVPARSGGSNFA
ncbi:unnamed protein product [Wuchereria bancrofti]|uniref:Uncharacterized protein n=1 Tax=Wuchereria bancrofti TaxID=6293 RepID=A0A3P7G4C1_WUCBA|nr:unnamed protein product [Wuchereria bancrofti]